MSPLLPVAAHRSRVARCRLPPPLLYWPRSPQHQASSNREGFVVQETRIERNLALELVRVTEMAAIAAGRWMGRGDKNAADGAAVDAMRVALSSVDMDGIVVIGEGEKDEA